MDVSTEFRTPYIRITYGRFDVCSNKKEHQVILALPDGSYLSQLFDDEPDVDMDTLPSDVVEILSARLESYLYISDRDAMRKKVEYARGIADEMDSAWAKAKIERLKQQIDDLSRYVISE